MTRRILNDDQWAIIEPFTLGKKSDAGQTGRDPRLFMEAVLWIVRSGANYRESLASGIQCSSGFEDGYRRTFFIECSKPYPQMQISNTS